MLNRVMRRLARWILILFLQSIEVLPSAKQSLRRLLARRPWLESHFKGFCYAHRLHLFDVPDSGATTGGIVWSNYDPAVRRLYGRLEQARRHHEARH